MSIGNTFASNIGSTSTVQKRYIYTQCITGAKWKYPGTVHITNNFMYKSGWSSSNAKQTSCFKYWVKIFQLNRFIYFFILFLYLFFYLFKNCSEAKHAICNFLCLGCRTVIITLGKDGAIFASSSDPKPIHVKPPRVEEVLDTTVIN